MPRRAPRVVTVRVIVSTLGCVHVQRPVLLWQDGFGAWCCTIRLSETCFVCMWRVAGDGFGWDGAVVVWVLRVGEAVRASDRATLRPPQARLACSADMPCFTHRTDLRVGTSACERAPNAGDAATLKARKHSVHCISWRWDHHRIVSHG